MPFFALDIIDKKGRTMNFYDKVIIGGGLYGLYSALQCGERGEKILVLEHDNASFKRATYINQARVHKGYHYPRSFSTAKKSADYFDRFVEDYGFCINSKFQKIYATSANFSYTNGAEFKKFCTNTSIPCSDLPTNWIFKEGMVDGAFITEEFTYDAQILLQYFIEKLSKLHNVTILYESNLTSVTKQNNMWNVSESHLGTVHTPFILNATYASVNQILNKFEDDYEPFKIKYELCEIILCEVNDALKDYGITVMDGPFFSIMPFGKTGYHSLTSVSRTPHSTSYDTYPTFNCQKETTDGFCSPAQLGNCNDCPAKPLSAWPYMKGLAKKYLRDDFKFKYVDSLFSMKPILMASEVDDSRPTVIKVFCEKPFFASVLSGKINTVYDLDDILSKTTKELL